MLLSTSKIVRGAWLLALCACGDSSPAATPADGGASDAGASSVADLLRVPPGFPTPLTPADNRLTREKVEAFLTNHSTPVDLLIDLVDTTAATGRIMGNGNCVMYLRIERLP